MAKGSSLSGEVEHRPRRPRLRFAPRRQLRPGARQEPDRHPHQKNEMETQIAGLVIARQDRCRVLFRGSSGELFVDPSCWTVRTDPIVFPDCTTPVSPRSGWESTPHEDSSPMPPRQECGSVARKTPSPSGISSGRFLTRPSRGAATRAFRRPSRYAPAGNVSSSGTGRCRRQRLIPRLRRDNASIGP